MITGCCCFVPDSLIAAITPLIPYGGNNPWTNMGPFVAGDLSVNGLKGDGSTKYLKTGLVANTIFSDNSNSGIALYCATDDAGGGSWEVGAGDNLGANTAMFLNIAGVDTFYATNSALGSVAGTLPVGFHGFHDGNATDGPLNGMNIFVANSVTSFQSIVHAGFGGSNAHPAQQFYIFADNNNGTVQGPYSPRRLSFCAFHNSMTSGEVQSLYNAVQALRVALGGGYV